MKSTTFTAGNITITIADGQKKRALKKAIRQNPEFKAAWEKQEAEKLQTEKQEAEKLEADKKQAEKLELQKIEAEKITAEKGTNKIKIIAHDPYNDERISVLVRKGNVNLPTNSKLYNYLKDNYTEVGESEMTEEFYLSFFDLKNTFVVFSGTGVANGKIRDGWELIIKIFPFNKVFGKAKIHKSWSNKRGTYRKSINIIPKEYFIEKLLLGDNEEAYYSNALTKKEFSNLKDAEKHYYSI